MFPKPLSALCLVILALSAGLVPAPARADDTGLLVHYECDTVKNRLVVKTFVSVRKPWETGKDNLPFVWLTGVGRSLECSFSTGDYIFVKAYYGDGQPADGDYQHVAIFVNNVRMKHLLDFGPYESETVRIAGARDHRVTISYSEK